MKLLKSILVVLMVVAMAAVVGCSKKDSPTAAGTTNPTAQQTVYAQSATSYGLEAIGFTKGFSGGLAGWAPGTGQPKSMIVRYGQVPQSAKWDTGGWHGPTAHSNYWNTTSAGGWYYYTLMDTLNLHMNFWAKFMPDTIAPTRVDWEFNLSMGDTITEYSAYCTEPTADLYTGGWYIGYNVGTTNLYYWRFTWSNVTGSGWTGTSRTCSGQFDYTSNYGVSGSFTFTGGTGTGSASLNGTVFVNYVFNSNGTGYYTIVGYTTQYPFTW